MLFWSMVRGFGGGREDGGGQEATSFRRIQPESIVNYDKNGLTSLFNYSF